MASNNGPQQPLRTSNQANKAPKAHIMLSYQWDSQAFAKVIFNELTSGGYEVWMDVEGGMQRDIYDSMAEAVEGAVVIVPLLTSKYMESANCKRELQYATGNQKTVIPIMCEKLNITGWLGVCIAGVLWHSAFGHTMDASALQAFHAAINDAIPSDSPVRKVKQLPHWENLKKKQPSELEAAGFNSLVESLVQLNAVKASYAVDSIKQTQSKVIEQIEDHFTALVASLSARKAQLVEQVETEFRSCYANAKTEVAKLDSYISKTAEALSGISALGATVLPAAIQSLKTLRESAGFEVQQLPKVTVDWPDSLAGRISTYGNVRSVTSPKLSLNKPAVVSTLAGGPPGFANGALKHSSFRSPIGVVHSAKENVVYVVDQANAAIRRIDLHSGTVGTLAGSGTAGFQDATGAAAQFNLPCHIAYYEKESSLFVADCTNNRIRKIASSGVVTTFAGSGTPSFQDGVAAYACFYSPFGIAVDQQNGNVFVADATNHRIRKITQQGTVSTLAGTGSPQFVEGCLHNPRGLTITQNGDYLYVADCFNHAIRRVCCKTGAMITIAGNGKAGFANGAGIVAQFHNPVAVALTADGSSLLVADHDTHCIRKVLLTDNNYPVCTIAGSSAQGFQDGELATAKFNCPLGVCFNQSAGVCYVADYGNHCIRSFSVNN